MTGVQTCALPICAAFHVDASRADTLTVESGNVVTEWRDANGGVLAARPPGANKPTLLAAALNGKPVVDFGVFGVSPYMHWFDSGGQVQLSNIRAVFWVIGRQNGGGFLLGATNTAHFHRGSAPNGVFEPVRTSSQIWGHDWGTYPGGGRVETYIDGIRRDNTAALNGGYQLVTCLISTNVTAGGFATDRNSFASRRGGQRLAEVIIYERSLTEQERIETEEYLMAKWFGDTRWDASGGDPYVTDINALGTRVVNTPDSGVVTIGRLAGGGALTKNGFSDLAVTDAQDYLGTVALGGGGLLLTAASVPAAPAPDAYFHVDASVTNAFVFDGTGRVLAWQDWRGNGRGASVQAGYVAPSLVLGGAGGLPVVDFGALGSLQALHWNHTNNAIRAAFVVFQSVGATASVLGGAEGQPQDFYRGANGQLYNTDTTPSRAVVYGANYVDGWQIEPMVATLPSRLCVVSVIPTTEARASAFALDRNNTGRSGGQRLAEVIVYNRVLTEKERRDTEAYLMRKWLNRVAPGYGAADMPQIGAVSYAGASLAVRVDGDGAAAIGQLSGGGSVVKSGSGTLTLGSGSRGFAGAVQVAEGAVAAASAALDVPAAFPVFHVDASQTNTMTFAEENGTNFITRWASVAVVSNAASVRAGFKLPYLITNDLAGLPAVGFGPFGSEGSCLKWEATVTSVRSVFVVLGSQEGGAYLLGAVNAPHFHRGNRSGNVFMPITKDNVLFGWDVSANVLNGATYLDGDRVASPTSQTLSGGYQLVEVLTTDNTTADLFGGDRTYTDRVGGQRLAEVIVYDRQLTERERLQTERYLQKKWFGRAATIAGLGTVAVAGNAGLAADVSPMAVNRLAGEGTVVKHGADVLTLVDITAFTGTVDVAAGTLNLAVPAAPLAPPANTLFWVDASKAGTIDTDANGGVTEWRDATGNGRYARPVPGRVTPTLRGNDFVGRSAVDMGPYGITGSTGMYWDQRITGMKTIAWVLGSQASGGYLLGATNATPFHRGPPPWGGQIAVTNFSRANYMLSQSWGATIPTAAYTNGVAVNTTTTGMSGGYQTLVMTWNGGTFADGFAFDRTFGDRYGGQRLAEFIAYDRVITEQERQDLQAYLDQKWLGIAAAGYARPATQTSVVLREGARLAMDGTEQCVIALSGAGSVSNGTLRIEQRLNPGFAAGDCVTLPVAGGLKLAAGAVLEIDFLSVSEHDRVPVSGELVFEGAGTVELRAPQRPASGWSVRIPVMTFGTLAGAANLSGWQVEGVPEGYKAMLSVDGQTVCLDIHANGTLIRLR